MDYLIYNNFKLLIKIKKYIMKDNIFYLEITLSDMKAFDIWEKIKQNLNSIAYLYDGINNNDNVIFILKECYINEDILILKGETK